MSGLEKLYFDHISYERALAEYNSRDGCPSAMIHKRPKRHHYYLTKSEMAERLERKRVADELMAAELAKYAAHGKIAKELFVAGGGIASMGVSQLYGWVPEVTLYMDYPRREELEANIFAIEPRAVIDYMPGVCLPKLSEN